MRYPFTQSQSANPDTFKHEEIPLLDPATRKVLVRLRHRIIVIPLLPPTTVIGPLIPVMVRLTNRLRSLPIPRATCCGELFARLGRPLPAVTKDRTVASVVAKVATLQPNEKTHEIDLLLLSTQKASDPKTCLLLAPARQESPLRTADGLDRSALRITFEGLLLARWPDIRLPLTHMTDSLRLPAPKLRTVTL